MLRPRRESHHRNGITDLNPLQQTSATKSARNGHRATADLSPLSEQKRTSSLARIVIAGARPKGFLHQRFKAYISRNCFWIARTRFAQTGCLVCCFGLINTVHPSIQHQALVVWFDGTGGKRRSCRNSESQLCASSRNRRRPDAIRLGQELGNADG